MEPDVKLWLDFAENNLVVAKPLWVTLNPQPLEIICYHCQQSAEKAIKAVYIACAIPGGIPYKHDLTKYIFRKYSSIMPMRSIPMA